MQSSMEVAGFYNSIRQEGKHTAESTLDPGGTSNLRPYLSRTRRFTDDISGVSQFEGYLTRRLESMTTKNPSSGDNFTSSYMQLWGMEGCIGNKRELTLESVLNSFHPVLDNLTKYLSTRDLIRLTNTSRTLRTLLVNHRASWRYLDFSYPPSSNRRFELLKNRRRIGFNLQNQSVYPEVGFTSELAIELLFKIPLHHLKCLVLDGTDISDWALRVFLNKAKSTLAYVSIRNCGHVQPCGLLEYFSRDDEVGLSRALRTLKLRGIPGVMRGSTRCDFVEGVSELGESISGLFDILQSLGVKTDIGFCAAGIEFCHTIFDNYPHATEGDGVIGLKKKRRCSMCKKAKYEAYCKGCEVERMCSTCEELGVATYLCRDCEPDSLDGVQWPHYCQCSRSMCALCFERYSVTYQDCPCFQCKECHRDHYLWPKERITITRYTCDHCGLDKCPRCWLSMGIKLRKCIECNRGLCETCGVKLACTDCNACICESCYDPAIFPITLQGCDWLCDYCCGRECDSSGSACIPDTCMACPSCTHLGTTFLSGSNSHCECENICHQRDKYLDEDKENLPEDPWAAAKQKRTSSDVTGSLDEQPLFKRMRLENTDNIINDSSRSCTII
ncbi:hypothetical protein BDZ91DRAFT_207616 [Kalaharituber pfeilii]|nr:hypothetical protein BDZ91DRAFT_207616 [Kalaharituber pfeilii]